MKREIEGTSKEILSRINVPIAGHAFIDDFVCRIEYDVTKKRGRLWVHKGRYGIGSALGLFSSIDSRVEQIEQYTDEVLVVIFMKEGDLWASIS